MYRQLLFVYENQRGYSGGNGDCTMSRQAESSLCVKELAATFGVSVHYVYQMRAAGLPMRWDFTHHCYVTTPQAALRWRSKTRFRVIDGRGVTKE